MRVFPLADLAFHLSLCEEKIKSCKVCYCLDSPSSGFNIHDPRRRYRAGRLSPGLRCARGFWSSGSAVRVPKPQRGHLHPHGGHQELPQPRSHQCPRRRHRTRPDRQGRRGLVLLHHLPLQQRGHNHLHYHYHRYHCHHRLRSFPP